MEDNKNNSKNEMSGFDSVQPGNTQPQDQQQDSGGYKITPEGGYFTAQDNTGVTAADNAGSTTDTEPVAEAETETVTEAESHSTEADKAAPDAWQGSEYHYSYVPPVKKPKRSFSMATVVVSVIVAAVIGTCSGIGAVLTTVNSIKDNDNTSSLTSSSDDAVNTPVTITVDKTVESVVEAVAEKVTPSVVGIRTTASVSSFFGSSEEATGEGSGIIYSTDGYIITNYHVVESAIGTANGSIKVYLQNSSDEGIAANVVGYNISYDLAVIKIQASNLNAIEFGDSSKLKVGQFVAAIGSPGGLEFMGSVTYGIISGLNRTISDGSSGNSVYLIQTDAAINPGNSGGALVNTSGQLIGINSSKIVSESYEGMGFAIPAATVREICDKIIDKENDPTPYIGITISERYDADTLKQLGYPVGAVVQSVVSGGPADEGKIRRADIITEFNGVEITDYTVLTDAISDCKPNQSVTVKIYRSGRYYSTSIKVGANNAQ